MVRLLPALLLFATACSRKSHHLSPDLVWENERVNAGFPTQGWCLFTGSEGAVGDPIEAFIKLYARKGATVLLVERPQDLAELSGIHVDTKEHALNFVKLFTKPDTFYLFDQPRALTLSARSDAALSEYGVIPDHIYRSLRLSPATVTKRSGAFLVRRFLLAPDKQGGAYPVIRVEERVTEDGTYQVISWRNVGAVASSDVRIPLFE